VATAPDADETDAALLRRYRRGEVAAFDQLYQRHRAGLYRFLCGLSGDTALADEIFQDTWLSLIRSQVEQRENVLFKTFLYQIGRNRLIDYWRRQGRHLGREEAYDEALHARLDEAPGPDQQWAAGRDRQRLQVALQALPEEQREVFLLRAEADLELQEIAELTRSPAETVKSRLRYAIQKLRRLLVDPAVTEEVRK
jgi:RNA polymerase sigma factor (sigma-70 family)